MGERKLIRNAMRTPDGTILQSFHAHDYKTHKDSVTGKIYTVDGGLCYIRRSVHGDEECLCLWNDEPHEVQREVLTWGTYGKDRDQALTRIAIKDMDTEHIKLVLEECNPSDVYRDCMENEIKLRQIPQTNSKEGI